MFKRKKNTTVRQLQPFLRQLSGRIGRYQRQATDRLNARTIHWTKRQKILFLSLSCGLLSALLVGSLYIEMGGAPSHRQLPMPLLQSARPYTNRFNHQDTVTFLAFRARLDSLQSTPEGRDSLRVFVARRPGFLDSMLLAESQIFPQSPTRLHSSRQKNLAP